MKKLLFSGILMFMFSLSYAQVGDFLQDTRFGIKVGGNYYRIHDFAGDDGRYGFNGGIFAQIPLSYDNQYYLQPELFFSQKGERNSKVTYALNYIDLPILFKAYFSERDSDFFGLVGPKISFLVDNSKFGNSDLNKVDFSFVGGLGYSFDRRYELSGRVEYGIPDVINTVGINNNVGVNLNLSYLF